MYFRQKMVSGSDDLFNRLPEPLLCHILSFLSTKEAASTSVLSKRWRDLLAFIPYLELDDSVYLHPERRVKDPLEGTQDYLDGFRTCIGDKLMKLSTSFPDFVDRILALQGKSPVNKFFLKIVDEEDPVDEDCVNPWIENVLERGVSDFHLVIELDTDSTLTPRIFLTETLVKLRLKNRDGPNIDIENVYLPNLKHLHLESVYFEEDDIGFNKLLSGCPVLEELVLDDIWSRVWDTFSVSLKTLKKLKFRCLLGDTGEELAYKVSFDTPNVVYLEYTELIAEKYPKVKFDSLVEAKINLSKLEDDDMVGNATDFILGISNVRVLYLSANTLEVLTLSCNVIPIFKNLTHLTIQSKAEVGWETLPNLLKNCQNLVTLVFEGLCHKATDSCGDMCLCNREEKDAEVISCLSSSPVKVLKIFINDDKTEKQTEQVKHFLKTMPYLEQLVLYYDPSFDDEVVAKLTKVASPKCKVQLIPDYNLRVSCTKPKKRVISRGFLDSN